MKEDVAKEDETVLPIILRLYTAMYGLGTRLLHSFCGTVCPLHDNSMNKNP